MPINEEYYNHFNIKIEFFRIRQRQKFPQSPLAAAAVLMNNLGVPFNCKAINGNGLMSLESSSEWVRAIFCIVSFYGLLGAIYSRMRQRLPRYIHKYLLNWAANQGGHVAKRESGWMRWPLICAEKEGVRCKLLVWDVTWCLIDLNWMVYWQ